MLLNTIRVILKEIQPRRYARMGPDPACNIGLIPVRLRHVVAYLHGSDLTSIIYM